MLVFKATFGGGLVRMECSGVWPLRTLLFKKSHLNVVVCEGGGGEPVISGQVQRELCEQSLCLRDT